MTDKVRSLDCAIQAKRLFPPKQFATLKAPTLYHDDLELLFYLDRDSDRYAMGWAWRCIKCNEEATTLEAYAPESQQFLLVKASCRKCGTYFLHPGCSRFATEEHLLLYPDDEWMIVMMKAWAYFAFNTKL